MALGKIFSLFHRKWEIKTSLIDAFATFFLLSYVKFANIAFDLLFPVSVHQLSLTGNVTSTWRLYATIPYFREKHVPYAILAIAVILLFVVLPSFIAFILSILLVSGSL